LRRACLAAITVITLGTSCIMDRAPRGLRRTPDGPGATVRYDIGHQPLPDIPLPTDTATWPDPTSRTGLRINASLVAPTNIERQARERFAQMEGWGTFAPITVSFDVDRATEPYTDITRAAVDLGNVKNRHQGDDYDFADDAVYVINLTTGVPAVMDVGAGNFNYTLKRLDRYWANDTRVTERNLLFETRDESQHGALAPTAFLPMHDTDFDGRLDIPNLDEPFACPDPDLARCDNVRHEEYASDECYEKRRARDQCISDHLMYFYERETDTLVLRPLLPLDEMTRYAVVITDRLVDGEGYSVKSPFEFIYHAAQEPTARRVMEILEDPTKKNYFGDIHCDGGACSGLDHVAFTWSFTTQPTVDDMKRLRDGLYGQGPFERWAAEYPPVMEVNRALGLVQVSDGSATEEPNWLDSADAETFGCKGKANDDNPNLYIVRFDDIRDKMRRLVVEGFGVDEGPGVELLMRQLDYIDYFLIGTFESPFLLEGGPKSTDPNSAFHLNFLTGEGEVNTDVVQFWMIVPKEHGEFKQPFDVNVYGHGYTGYFVEQVLYAGNMAAHGLATVGINAMGHGVVFDDPIDEQAAEIALRDACAVPFFEALTQVRARDLDNDGRPDSGGDFWSSYLFHTRDGVRQSVLDHIQLVRILRSFGTSDGKTICRTAGEDGTGWSQPATQPCDVKPDGKAEAAGDFDGNGVHDVGGPSATYGTWGESLGGILSAIHGSIDAYVTAAVPGSGGGGLTDIGIRSFQGGVIEAVLLRIWGPLVVSIPSTERPRCDDPEADKPHKHCTVCDDGQHSLRWVVPDVNGTGEVEIDCVDPADIEATTVMVYNLDNGESRCARVDAEQRLRVGIPASIGDQIQIDFYAGDIVQSFDGCQPVPEAVNSAQPVKSVLVWGPGRFLEGGTDDLGRACSGGPTCRQFQGTFLPEGSSLVAPAEGFGQLRQTPSSRRFLQLAQTALDPGDPISFAPYYSIKQMSDPFGNPIAPHAVLTLNTIGDMNVPLNSGIAFARATGALPFLRPDQATLYPEYANYATPAALYVELGDRTPNQELIDRHVIEGITALARHPAATDCATSANAAPLDATFLTLEGEASACFPGALTTPCTEETEGDPQKRVCYYDTFCDVPSGQCLPNPLGKLKCDEALWDADNLDEGKHQYHENDSTVPHRLARYTQPATPETIDAVWAPRLRGTPFGADGSWEPDASRPLTALLDAYTVPEGEHTFVNGEPCQAWDHGTYLSNLTARFFMTNGTDLYYLSHPATHHCLASQVASCDYSNP
jgi:hypothetical protein